MTGTSSATSSGTAASSSSSRAVMASGSGASLLNAWVTPTYGVHAGSPSITSRSVVVGGAESAGEAGSVVGVVSSPAAAVTTPAVGTLKPAISSRAVDAAWRRVDRFIVAPSVRRPTNGRDRDAARDR